MFQELIEIPYISLNINAIFPLVLGPQLAEGVDVDTGRVDEVNQVHHDLLRDDIRLLYSRGVLVVDGAVNYSDFSRGELNAGLNLAALRRLQRHRWSLFQDFHVVLRWKFYMDVLKCLPWTVYQQDLELNVEFIYINESLCVDGVTVAGELHEIR